MDNNDLFRRLRYILSYDESQLKHVFHLAEREESESKITNWLRREDDPDFWEMKDVTLATFLNGLINHKRGKREGPQPPAETRLDNNLIFKKLKIAFNLRSEDIMDIFRLAERDVSEHEITAFLRNPRQGKFRPFNDQYMRNFIAGMQLKYKDKYK